ncbi:MAG: chemotaxis protein CheB [Dehalococcoidia bacterium]
MAIKRDRAKPKTKQASSKTEESPATVPVRKATPLSQKGKTDFPIVGIGASAGGLEALQELFTNMPSDTGMGFVVVSHLDPSHVSILPELLQKCTDMPVYQTKDGMGVKPNNIYVIPPNKNMGILHGNLILLEIPEPHGLRLPINFFLRALAQDRGRAAIGIILSGSGTDGTLGLREIRGETGLAIVQEPSSAKYDGMPRQAIDSGLADFVLRPSEMPARLFSLAGYSKKEFIEERPTATVTLPDYLAKVFLLLRQYTKHDFSQYKPATLNRRIERRMTINQIDNIARYVSFLEQHPAEAQALFSDLLISVTQSFRDKEAFVALKSRVKTLISERSSRSPLRIWVPGCATGEEAYSITMIVIECLGELNQGIDIQVFATDIDDAAIDRARSGIYPIGICADVSPERLHRFFIQTEDTYIIKREIRERVIFAVQDIIKDPPFSKVDLICCRNLLIYLNSDLQARLVPLLYYSLNKDGILFLGSAETIGKHSDLFSVLDKRWKIYQRREVTLLKKQQMQIGPIAFQREPAETGGEPKSDTAKPFNIAEIVNKILLQKYTPACVVVDQSYDVLYVHGQTGKYLELPTGPLKMNILDMAREGLRAELASALRTVFLKDQETSCYKIEVKQDDNIQLVDLKVSPIAGLAGMQKLCSVMFQTVTSPEPEAPTKTKRARSTRSHKRIVELDQELALSKETLSTTREEMEKSNEEFQSTNEELETSREELQSTNEELMTVNAELQEKAVELSKTNDDLNNLLNSTQIASIFLDMNLHIRRFTPATTTIFNLIESDIGRPIHHVTSNLLYDKLDEDLNKVLDRLVPKSIEVQAKDARSYTLHILPYRTVGNVIQGLVLTMVDITEEKKAAREVAAAKAAKELAVAKAAKELAAAKAAKELAVAEAAQEVAESIANTVREPLIVLSGGLRIISANNAFYNMFQVSKEDTEKKLIYEIGNRQWDIPKLRELLEDILPEKAHFNDYEVDHFFPTVGHKTILLNARRIQPVKGHEPMILLAMEDITEQKQHKKGVS